MDPTTTTTCFRHPDRVAGVRCQRCERPICPQCMVQASVGFQCPECAHSGSQQVISSRQVWAPSSQDVIVGKVLIGLNVAAFLLASLAGGSLARTAGPIFERFVTWGPLVADGEWWRLVTGAFLHGGVLHLMMNMFLLWLLAKELEPALGHVGFALVFAVSVVGGALGVMLLSPNDPTLGASGGVFGLMGALIVLQLRARQNPWNSGIGGLVVVNLILTFTIPGISIGGHVGGLLAGAAAGAVVQPKAWPQTSAGIRNGFLVLMSLGLVVAAVLVAGALATDLSSIGG
ncbi:MAG: rhomboid family intramembrane serine protease [Microthrixaceae bacterium]